MDEIAGSMSFGGAPMSRPDGEAPADAAGMTESGAELPDGKLPEDAELPELPEVAHDCAEWRKS